jgi:cytosine/adenosine deaminase-related metal-dependent hydrolase
VVWCPSSNIEMLGSTLDPARLAAAGRLALGTDSRLSGSRDLLDEMRIALGHGLSPSELYGLVTDRASTILCLRDRGRLVAGSVADCVIVREDGDPYDTILRASRGAIRAVVRDGAPVIADPDFADWFVACDVEPVAVCLDGRPKLMAKRVARRDAVSLEPGLTLE